jgi:spore coat protein CotH
MLLAVPLLAAGLAGCAEGTEVMEVDRDSAPFYADRVVTVRISMSEDDWEYMRGNARAEEYTQADFLFDDELVPDVAVRPKGNSSLKAVADTGNPRFSLKVDFNFFNSARSFYGLKKLNFNNGFSDPTLIREALGYEVFDEMGLPAPRTSFVDLWVNDTHMGVYTMVEQVDASFLESRFVDATGNLYKPETIAAPLKWTEEDLPENWEELAGIAGEDINLGGGKLEEIMNALGQGDGEEGEEEINLPENVRVPWADIPARENVRENPPRDELPPWLLPGANITREEFLRNRGLPGGNFTPGNLIPGREINFIEQIGLKTNENNPDYSGLFRLLEVVNNEPDETFPEEIAKVLDVDQMLRYLAVSAAIVHLDNYIGLGHNYYLYEVDGKFTIIPWDLNMAFGTFNAGLDRNKLVNYYIDEPTSGAVEERPLIRLLDYQPYLDTYHSYLEEIIDGPLSSEVMNERIKELAELIRPYVAEDDLKFFSTVQFNIALNEDLSAAAGRPGGGGMRALGLRSFISDRIKSIRLQLDGIRPSGSGDGSGNGGLYTAGRR